MNVSSDTSRAFRRRKRVRFGPGRALILVLVMLVAMLLVGPSAFAAGGAYTLNFAAADPSIYIPPIPFPNDLTAPTGRGDGDLLIPSAKFNDGTSDVRVESLAPQDMALGQIVPFETKISVSGDTTPENGVITFVIGWNTLTTNSDDFGYDARGDDVGYGVIGAFIDTGDGAHLDPGGDATVDSFTWSLINDEIVGIFTVSGLDDDDVVVLEPWLVLDDTIPAGVGGNVQSRLIDAATGSDQTINVANSGAITLVNGDSISTGNQTVPLLKPSDFFNADVDLSVTKTDDVDPIAPGETLIYTITASNAGPSIANSVIVYDELDPNVTFVSASDGGFINTDAGDTIPDGAVQWDVGALAPGDTVVFTVVVTVNLDAPTDSPTGEDLVNTVTIITISDDTDPTNDTDTEPTDVTALGEPELTLVKSTTTTSYAAVGDLIDYSYDVTNSGNVTLAEPVTIADDKTTATCALSGDGDLDVGETVTCTAVDYVVTQADIDAGFVTNTATASADGTTSNEDFVTVTATQTPALTLDKSTTTATYAAVGDTIDYSYDVTNSGNVTLAEPVTIADDKTTATCALSGDGDLDVGETVTCTAVDYVVTQADIDFGSVTNLATASADGTDSNLGLVTVDATQSSALSVDKVLTNNADEDTSGTISLGDTLTYDITATNTGNMTLNNVTVDDDLTGDSTSCLTVAPGDTCVLTVAYVVTQANVDAGEIVNTGTADLDETPSTEDPEDVPVPQNPALAVDKVLVDNVDEDGSGTISLADTLTYDITATNTGNVTLNNVTVDDDLTGDSTSCLTVAPGDTCVLTVAYVVTQADVDAGEIVNTGTADLDETPPTEDPEDVPVPQNPALAVDKVLVDNADEDGSGTISLADTLTYDITATNTGNVTLNNVTVDDDLTGDSTSCLTVAPGDTCVLTVAYVVTQADVDAGEIVNTGTADSDETPPTEDPEDVPVPQNPALAVDKVLVDNADEDGSGTISLADTLTYDITATNTGDVTLNNVTVDDDLTGDLTSCLTVAPGDTCVLTVAYVVTQADVDAGEIVNTGTADLDETPSTEDPEDVPVPQNPALAVDKVLVDNADEDGSGTISLADTLTYDITATNTGDVTLNNVTVDDDLTGDSTSCLTVAPGDTCVLTVAYVVTQADVDAGEIVNTGTADLDETPSTEDPEDVPVPQNPSILADKVLEGNADEDGSNDVSLGDTLSYKITATNNGDVTLTNVTVDDDLTGTTDAFCAASLTPGASCFVVVTYEVTQADVDAGQIDNLGTVEGTDPNGDPQTDTDPETVPVPQNPSIVLVKIGTFQDEDGDGFADVGETIVYAFTVTNDGNVTLTDVTLADTVGGVTISGGPIATLAVGASDSTTFSGSYTITQDDIDSGSFFNLATAIGSDPNGDPTSDADTHSEDLPQNPSIVLVKTGTFQDENGDGFADVGETIVYAFTVTNDGNVTLTDVTLADTVGSVTISGGPIATLAVGASDSTTFSGNYAITQADIDSGSFNNVATATGTDPNDEPVTDADNHDETLPQNPSIAIVKTTADDFGNEGDNLGILPGENVTWNYVVSNDGNVTLSNVSVTDDQLGLIDCGSFDGELSPGESVTCTVSDIAGDNAATGGWYNNLGTANGEGPQEQPVEDSDPSSYYSLTPGAVTNSQLCDFGDQFRLLFTPDMQRFSSSTPFYKLSDSNPGQTFYNTFYVNDGSTETITLEIPYPYVTQGANPVHVYGGLFVDPMNSDPASPDNLVNCFDPTNELAAHKLTFGLGDYTDTNEDGVTGFGDVYSVEVPAEFGFQYINIHLDYGLEKTKDWEKKGANVLNDGLNDPSLTDLAINDNTAHTFNAYADGALIAGSTDTVYNLNEFKQVRGFGGLVQSWNGVSYEAIEGAQVRLIGPDGAIETMTTDSDGWYLSDYRHKGKAATYTLRLLASTNPTYPQQEITGILVGGKIKFGEGSFLIPPLP